MPLRRPSRHQIEDVEGPHGQYDVSPRRLELGAADRDRVAGQYFRIGVLALGDLAEVEARRGPLTVDGPEDERLVERGDLRRTLGQGDSLEQGRNAIRP